MDEGPHRGGQSVGVDAGEGAVDDAADVFRDGGGRADPFLAVRIAGLREHHPEQRGTLQRETDVGDGDRRELVGRRGRGMRRGQVFGEFAVALRGDRRDERVTVREMAVGSGRRDTGPPRHRPQGQSGAAVLLQQLPRGTQTGGAQIAVVVRAARLRHGSHSLMFTSLTSLP